MEAPVAAQLINCVELLLALELADGVQPAIVPVLSPLPVGETLLALCALEKHALQVRQFVFRRLLRPKWLPAARDAEVLVLDAFFFAFYADRGWAL